MANMHQSPCHGCCIFVPISTPYHCACGASASFGLLPMLLNERLGLAMTLCNTYGMLKTMRTCNSQADFVRWTQARTHTSKGPSDSYKARILLLRRR